VRDGKWQVMLADTGQQPMDMGSWRYQFLVVAQREFNVTCFTPASDSITAGITDDELVGFDVACEPVGYMQLRLQSANISVTPETLDWGSC
jgi:hypothetical protein